MERTIGHVMKLLLIGAALVTGLTLVARLAEAQQYELRKLGAIGTSIKDLRVNDRGDIAGTRYYDCAFFVDGRSGAFNELCGYADILSINDINNRGQVVGTLRAGQIQVKQGVQLLTRGFIWDSTNGLVALPNLHHGDNHSSAIAINDQGVVVGYSGVVGENPEKLGNLAQLRQRAFSYTVGGGMKTVLENNEETDEQSVALDISAEGDVLVGLGKQNFSFNGLPVVKQADGKLISLADVFARDELINYPDRPQVQFGAKGSLVSDGRILDYRNGSVKSLRISVNTANFSVSRDNRVVSDSYPGDFYSLETGAIPATCLVPGSNNFVPISISANGTIVALVGGVREDELNLLVPLPKEKQGKEISLCNKAQVSLSGDCAASFSELYQTIYQSAPFADGVECIARANIRDRVSKKQRKGARALIRVFDVSADGQETLLKSGRSSGKGKLSAVFTVEHGRAYKITVSQRAQRRFLAKQPQRYVITYFNDACVDRDYLYANYEECTGEPYDPGV